MKTTLRALIAAIAFIATGLTVGPAFAHDDATLDTMKSPNGGQMRMAGMYHFELVVAKDSKTAKANPVTVYLTDHGGNKIPSAGASGTATLLAGSTKTVVTLAPAGDNKLSGTGNYASDPQLKAVVSLTFADKKTEQARFTPMGTAAPATAAAGGHQH